VVVPGYPHHVTQRGNRRQQTFFGNGDYGLYRELMAEWCAERRVAVWAYCLMPNHVHLILVPSTEEGLGLAVGEAHRRYSRHINFREDWRGHLWQGRFGSYVMDEAHLLAAARYIERNPVRAGLCRRPWRYPWSSARAHVEGRDDELVKVEPLLRRVPDWKEFIGGKDDGEEAALLRRHERTGRPLGSESFLKRLERKLGLELRPKKRGPKGPWKHKAII
jgi:putative transposase